MSQPRVLFVAPSAYLLGGLATWLEYLLPGLNASGWDATLGLVSGPRHHRPAAYLEHHPTERWIEIPCNTGTRTGRIRAMQRAIKTVRPDIVLSVNIPDALLATAQERPHFNIRCAMTCHGIQEDLFQDMSQLHGMADAIVCTNQLACELARSFASWESERVLYASYGTELHPLPSAGETVELTVGYAGRLEQDQKRIHDIPLLLQELRKRDVATKWLIAGNGPEEEALKASLENEIQSGQVTLLGHVPASELNESFYHEIDCLFVPSQWETGPIVIWEAMAQGIPVLTSRYVGSGREAALKHHRNCLMFEIGDMSEAGQMLEMLTKSPELYRQLQEEGWELIQQRYSHQASIQHWDDVLNQILALPPQEEIYQPAKQVASGKLSRWLGEDTAETIRQLLGKQVADFGPAGEWPHRLSGGTEIQDFWQQATQLDRNPILLPAVGGTSC